MCLGPEIMAGLGSLATAAGGASTLVPLGLGLGASVLGGQLQANEQRRLERQQLAQDLASTAAQNQRLKQFLGTQREYSAANQKQFNTALGAVPQIASTQAGQTGQRIADANQAIDSGMITNIAPISSTGSSAGQSDLDARTGAAINKAKAASAASAGLGAYGDANSAIDTGIGSAGRNIDITNDFARGDARVFRDQLGFDDFIARVGNRVPPANTWGQGVQGLGNVFAALAGSGRLRNIFG